MFYGLSVLRMDLADHGLVADGRIRREPEHSAPILRGPDFVARKSHIQTPRPAASVARLRRSSLSRRTWSDRLRAMALAKICATSCSRFTSASGQGCSSLHVIEGQGADQRPLPRRERDRQRRLDPEMTPNLLVAGGLGRELVQG